jgi:hypothetical protein
MQAGKAFAMSNACGAPYPSLRQGIVMTIRSLRLPGIGSKNMYFAAHPCRPV